MMILQRGVYVPIAHLWITLFQIIPTNFQFWVISNSNTFSYHFLDIIILVLHCSILVYRSWKPMNTKFLQDQLYLFVNLIWNSMLHIWILSTLFKIFIIKQSNFLEIIFMGYLVDIPPFLIILLINNFYVYFQCRNICICFMVSFIISYNNNWLFRTVNGILNVFYCKSLVYTRDYSSSISVVISYYQVMYSASIDYLI